MRTIYLLTFAMILGITGNAQILRGIGNKAINQAQKSTSERASKEVEKQVDKGVNKFFDSLLKEDSTKVEPDKEQNEQNGSSSSSGLDALMNKMGISTETLPYKKSYRFTGQAIYTYELTDDQDKLITNEYKSCFNDKNGDFMIAEINDKGPQTLFDQENQVIILLYGSEGEKTGVVAKMDTDAINDVDNLPSENEALVETACKPTPTGKKKTISGYKCKEYLCDNSEVSIVMWVTKELDASNNRFFNNGSSVMDSEMESINGMLVRYEMHSKTDEASTVMTLKSFDKKKSSSFSTSDYKLSSFSIGEK